MNLFLEVGEACRSLARGPGFAVTAIMTLALGRLIRNPILHYSGCRAGYRIVDEK